MLLSDFSGKSLCEENCPKPHNQLVYVLQEGQWLITRGDISPLHMHNGLISCVNFLLFKVWKLFFLKKFELFQCWVKTEIFLKRYRLFCPPQIFCLLCMGCKSTKNGPKIQMRVTVLLVRNGVHDLRNSPIVHSGASKFLCDKQPHLYWLEIGPTSNNMKLILFVTLISTVFSFPAEEKLEKLERQLEEFFEIPEEDSEIAKFKENTEELDTDAARNARFNFGYSIQVIFFWSNWNVNLRKFFF